LRELKLTFRGGFDTLGGTRFLSMRNNIVYEFLLWRTRTYCCE